MANKNKHKQKMFIKRKKVVSLSINDQKDNLKQELFHLKAAHIQEISSTRGESLEIKNVYQNSLKDQKFRGVGTRCLNCTLTKARCGHCFCCGSGDRIRSKCRYRKN